MNNRELKIKNLGSGKLFGLGMTHEVSSRVMKIAVGAFLVAILGVVVGLGLPREDDFMVAPASFSESLYGMVGWSLIVVLALGAIYWWAKRFGGTLGGDQKGARLR